MLGRLRSCGMAGGALGVKEEEGGREFLVFDLGRMVVGGGAVALAVIVVLLDTAAAAAAGSDGGGFRVLMDDDDPCEGVCERHGRSCVVAGNGRAFCADCTGLLKLSSSGSLVECCAYSPEHRRCATTLKSSRAGICMRSDELFLRSPELTPASVRNDLGYACSKIRDMFDNGLACRLRQRRSGLKCEESDGSFMEPPCDGSFAQLGQDIDGEDARDRSGAAVAMSADGRRVAIGARQNSDNGRYTSGHVRVYELRDRDGSVWRQVGDDIDGEEYFDRSGTSVAMSTDGNRVAIGAVGNDGNGEYSGHVRVFQWNGSGQWVQLGQDVDGEAEGDSSGSSVAMSSDGNRLAIGASSNSQNGPLRGHVRVFELRQNSKWVQVGEDIDGEADYDNSGRTIAMSADGNRVAIDSNFNDDNGVNAGHVQVYELNRSGEWAQVGEDIDGEAAGDFSGSSVAMSADGRRVAIGAYANEVNGAESGHIRVFESAENGEWVQIGADIDGQSGEGLGLAVAMSSDGTRVAGGAPGGALNGPFSGLVRLFELQGNGRWVQIGKDIPGEDERDYVAQKGALALSADGLRVAIGSDLNQGNGRESGHVRVFEFTASCRE